MIIQCLNHLQVFCGAVCSFVLSAAFNLSASTILTLFTIESTEFYFFVCLS